MTQDLEQHDPSDNGNSDDTHERATILPAIIEHPTPASMAAALTSEIPEGRVFTHLNLALGLMGDCTVTFVSRRCIHIFSGMVSGARGDRERLNAVDQLFALPEKRGDPEAEGFIRVNGETGEIYRIYQTAEPGDPDQAKTQVVTWVEDVQQAVAAGAEGAVQHVTLQDGLVIIGYSNGSDRLITALFPASEATLDLVLAQLPGVKVDEARPEWADTLYPEAPTATSGTASRRGWAAEEGARLMLEQAGLGSLGFTPGGTALIVGQLWVND